jgi:hypothetical protein
MPNIPSCVILQSLSGSCDIQVMDKTSSTFIISIDEVFNDLHKISHNINGEGSNTNCSNKEPEEINFNEAAER